MNNQKSGGSFCVACYRNSSTFWDLTPRNGGGIDLLFLILNKTQISQNAEFIRHRKMIKIEPLLPK